MDKMSIKLKNTNKSTKKTSLNVKHSFSEKNKTRKNQEKIFFLDLTIIFETCRYYIEGKKIKASNIKYLIRLQNSPRKKNLPPFFNYLLHEFLNNRIKSR